MANSDPPPPPPNAHRREGRGSKCQFSCGTRSKRNRFNRRSDRSSRGRNSPKLIKLGRIDLYICVGRDGGESKEIRSTPSILYFCVVHVLKAYTPPPPPQKKKKKKKLKTFFKLKKKQKKKQDNASHQLSVLFRMINNLNKSTKLPQ